MPRVTTPYGAATTPGEVLTGVSLAGRRAVVTGATSGPGLETARVLAGAGAAVTLAVRDRAAGLRAARLVGGDVTVAPLGLAHLASVRAFAAAWEGPLHILVNNAGIRAAPLARTADGWELQFATNHLGHFTLATGLHDALAAAGDARVVSVSSDGHLAGGVDFDDVNFVRRPYDPWVAYSQSKTANILFAVEAARRWAGDGITVNAAGRGAATVALLAGSPLVGGVTGRYFEDCNEALPQVHGVRRGVAPHALDPAAAARLWTLSTT
ncbi:SDR family NAD(P)-dependent oxidoreductase [Dactylosporangium fulvum]|uniref:SDR family NAD(P)-dependent oxidoreductase n=1 Tax=Dactylosporangium fulvum TaxID=53359 RepID=A0ABY5VLX3_9ACTN|nr:SDR family NAD(P)-dependent oxidoreductase [Dactylosporangium fulvum]UWP78518.1 SDR family NAD(P)-dependent oxidoreductase [Dactylosporangium fulvum]